MQVLFTYWLQWHLHKQLAAASAHAATRRVVLKGDLPIGVDKRSVDAWVEVRHSGDWGSPGVWDDLGVARHMPHRAPHKTHPAKLMTAPPPTRGGHHTPMQPALFRMDKSTGAPPDLFDPNGQNWGFPTYNWEEMGKDGYGEVQRAHTSSSCMAAAWSFVWQLRARC